VKFAIRHRDELVGAFLLGGILFLVGALLFMGLNRRWFQTDPRYSSHFETAEGLSVGMALEMQGFAVGRVKQVRLTEDRLAEAVFSVHREYADLIRPGSVVDLAVQPLGFGAKLVLYPGRGSGDPLPAGTVIASTDQPAGRDLIERGAVVRPRRRDDAALLLGALPQLITEVQTLVVSTNRMVEGLDRKLLGQPDGTAPGLLDDSAQLVRTLEATLAAAGELPPRLGPALEELQRLLKTVNGLAERLSAPGGMATALVGTEGTAAQIFQDQGALYAELMTSMQRLNELLAFFEQSTPELAALLGEATAALDAGGKVAEGLSNHPLLRGGVTPEPDGPGPFSGYRREEP